MGTARTISPFTESKPERLYRTYQNDVLFKKYKGQYVVKAGGAKLIVSHTRRNPDTCYIHVLYGNTFVHGLEEIAINVVEELNHLYNIYDMLYLTMEKFLEHHNDYMGEYRETYERKEIGKAINKLCDKVYNWMCEDHDEPMDPEDLYDEDEDEYTYPPHVRTKYVQIEHDTVPAFARLAELRKQHAELIEQMAPFMLKQNEIKKQIATCLQEIHNAEHGVQEQPLQQIA